MRVRRVATIYGKNITKHIGKKINKHIVTWCLTLGWALALCLFRSLFSSRSLSLFLSLFLSPAHKTHTHNHIHTCQTIEHTRKESEMGFCVVVVPFVLLVEILLSFSNDCNARTVLVFCICRDGPQSVLLPRCPCAVCVYSDSNIHDSCSFHGMFSAALIATFRLGAAAATAAVVDTTATASASVAVAVVYFVFLYWTNRHGDNKANRFNLMIVQRQRHRRDIADKHSFQQFS